MRHRLAFPAFLFSMVFLLTVVGCWNPFKPPDRGDPGNGNGGGEILERTSPENVLNNLQVIYSEKDDIVNTADDAHAWAEEYRLLFHPDFKFYFVPNYQVPGWPEDWWGRDHPEYGEVVAFEAMLNAKVEGFVESVDLSWTINPAVDDNRVDEYGQPLHEGWKWIHVTSLLLDLVETSGQVWRVPSGTADFYFASDPADSTLWVVTEWWDREVG